MVEVLDVEAMSARLAPGLVWLLLLIAPAAFYRSSRLHLYLVLGHYPRIVRNICDGEGLTVGFIEKEGTDQRG